MDSVNTYVRAGLAQVTSPPGKPPGARMLRRRSKKDFFYRDNDVALSVPQSNTFASHALEEFKTIQLAKRAARRIKRFVKIRTSVKGRFRRIARVVFVLVKVCIVCRRLTQAQVARESWHANVQIITEVMTPNIQRGTRSRPFVTLVPNDRRELVQLSFDLSQYTREYGADYLLTDSIREVFMCPGPERTNEQVDELVRFFKRFTVAFGQFPLDSQRRLCRCMQYDRYEKRRVVTMQGGQADGLYVLLAGTVLEKPDEDPLSEIHPGECFGQEDLKCARPRRVTTLTGTPVELVFVHRLDYMAIFNMTNESHDPEYLKICNKDEVFQHFPMQKLIENPSTWSVLSYKFGRLIVKDSNDLEWIYIITGGEARVIKHLKTREVDLSVRRRQNALKSQQDDPFRRSRTLLNFVSDEVKSSYAPGRYQPLSTKRITAASAPVNGRGTTARRKLAHTTTIRRRSKSAAVTSLPRDSTEDLIHPSPSVEKELNRVKEPPRTDNSVSEMLPLINDPNTPRQPVKQKPREPIVLDEIDIVQRENGSKTPERNTLSVSRNDRIQRLSAGTEPRVHLVVSHRNSSANLSVSSDSEESLFSSSSSPKDTESNVCSLDTRAEYIATATRPATCVPSKTKQKPPVNPHIVSVPPFVQLECLHSGKVFGLRSCLEPEERGPSVSLVSGGCEVLQINKKFFLKHIDDALLGLIRVKHRAFPTEEELINRLDRDLQWEEFKQQTVVDFFRVKGRNAAPYSTPFTKVS